MVRCGHEGFYGPCRPVPWRFESEQIDIDFSLIVMSIRNSSDASLQLDVTTIKSMYSDFGSS